MSKLILAIDIGSSSVRCSAYEIQSKEGELVPSTLKSFQNCRASRVVRSVQPNTGKIHLSNGKTLMDNVDECIDEILDRLRKMEMEFQVLAVAISSFVMNLVGVDSNGQIVGDAASISYACNAPSVAKQCKALRSRLSEETRKEMYQNTGAPIHSAYALPQLLDIYDDNNTTYDGVRAKVHKWQTIASICLNRWIGTSTLPISFSEASWTGLLNYQTCDFETSLVDLLPPSCRQSLPELADVRGTSYSMQQARQDGSSNNPYWDRWPELRGALDGEKGCQLFLGLGDGACANIGSKCSTDSRIAVTVGTSAAARVCLPCPKQNDAGGSSIRVPPGLFCYRIDGEHILVGGALTDGGSVVEWISELLNLKSAEALDACMKQVEALVETDYNSSKNDSNTSLTVVPFLSGERSTGYRDGATGAILGLTRETTPAHLLKSSLEGVTLRLKAVLDLIKKTMDDRNDSIESLPSVIASGKALEVNSLWRQLVSDSCGLEVIMDAETEEGTSRGAALVVATAMSGGNFVDEPLCVKHRSKPNPSSTDHWQQAKVNQESFIDAISPLFGTTL